MVFALQIIDVYSFELRALVDRRLSCGRLYCKKLNDYHVSQEFLRLTDVYYCCGNSLAE